MEIRIATAAPGDCGDGGVGWAISAAAAEARQAAQLIGGTYHCLDERDGMIVYDKPTLQKAADLFRRVARAGLYPRRPETHGGPRNDLAFGTGGQLYPATISAFPLREGTGVPHLYYVRSARRNRPAGRTDHAHHGDRHYRAQLQRRAKCSLVTPSQTAEWLAAYHGMDEYLDSMRRHAALRGRQAGVPAAEAFVQHRGHAYPPTTYKQYFGGVALRYGSMQIIVHMSS